MNDPKNVYPLVAHFNEIWRNKHLICLTKNCTANKKVAAYPEPSSINFYFNRTTNNVEKTRLSKVLCSEMKKAKKSIDILAYSYTNANINSCLVAAARRKVKVRILFNQLLLVRDQKSITPWLEQAKSRLRLKNLNIKYIWLAHVYGKNKRTGKHELRSHVEQKLHHKIFIIDNHVLTLGSYNFSQGADKRNHENLVVVDAYKGAENKKVLKTAMKEFKALWFSYRAKDYRFARKAHWRALNPHFISRSKSMKKSSRKKS